MMSQRSLSGAHNASTRNSQKKPAPLPPITKVLNGERQSVHSTSTHSSPARSSTTEEMPSSSSTEDRFKDSSQPTLKEAFDFFDIDRDGKISCSELNAVLKFLGNDVTSQEVVRMIEEVDTDGNGTVEFNEFVKMMQNYQRKVNPRYLEDDDMWETFKAFDHNGDNYIDFNEIKATMHFLGERISDDDVRSMVAEADADHDGFIDFYEFKSMMSRMRTPDNTVSSTDKKSKRHNRS